MGRKEVRKERGKVDKEKENREMEKKMGRERKDQR